MQSIPKEAQTKQIAEILFYDDGYVVESVSREKVTFQYEVHENGQKVVKTKKAYKKKIEYKKQRVLVKRVPLLVIHVADVEDRNRRKSRDKSDPRKGDPIPRLITPSEYANWVANLAADFYGPHNLDMSKVVFPTYNDVKDLDNNTVQKGLHRMFYETVGY